MNNERYNQIIDEAYENYSKEYEKDNSIGMTLLVLIVDGKAVYYKPDKQRFIAMCTYDKSFSDRWRLKIEERELSLEERRKLANYESEFVSPMTVESWDRNNIPTKLITIIYKGEKIEVYE